MAADRAVVSFLAKARERRIYAKAKRRVSLQSHPLRMCV